MLVSFLLLHDFHHINTEEIKIGVPWIVVVRFWIRVSEFEAATAWNRGIPNKILEQINQMLILLLSSLWFLPFIKQVIKGKNFINDKETICQKLRQLRTEIGYFLAVFKNHEWNLICCYFVAILGSPTMEYLPVNLIEL